MNCRVRLVLLFACFLVSMVGSTRSLRDNCCMVNVVGNTNEYISIGLFACLLACLLRPSQTSRQSKLPFAISRSNIHQLPKEDRKKMQTWCSTPCFLPSIFWRQNLCRAGTDSCWSRKPLLKLYQLLFRFDWTVRRRCSQQFCASTFGNETNCL